jgi:hypothetical protein
MKKEQFFYRTRNVKWKKKKKKRSRNAQAPMPRKQIRPKPQKTRRLSRKEPIEHQSNGTN